MTTAELEALKRQIDEAKAASSRAEGAMNTIKQQWVAEFGVSTLAEAEVKLQELDADLERDETRLQGLLDDIKAKATS
jgi:hypothetical protein